jgi:hypothetical protein
MRRAVPFVLALGLLALLPIAAQAAPANAQTATLDQLHGAIFTAPSPLPPYEDPPGCDPVFSCNRVFNSCTYHHQKLNGMCVYICSYTETCTDIACGTGTTTTTGTQRYRIGPFVPGACPAGSTEIVEQGEPD